MIVVGVDLSLTSTGIARLHDGEPAIFNPKPTKEWELGRRLDTIALAVWNASFDADLVVVEDLPYNARSAGLTGMVHGVIRRQLWQDKRPTLTIPPATLKTFALGKGTGTKTEVTLAAARRLGYEGHSDDEADALWLAHLGAHWLGQPAVDLPQTHLRALAKLPKREVAA